MYLHKRGFTLIELLVVITIIGILATFIVASFTSAQRKSRDARRKSDLNAVKKALAIYYSDTSTYSPLPNNPWFAAFSDATWGANGSNANSIGQRLKPTYIKTVPQDPSSSTNDYYLRVPTGVGNTYTLSALLENTSDPVLSSLTCTPEAGRNYCLSED